MTTRFTQLGNDLEQIIAGVEMRRHARRNWMERLMLKQDDSNDNTEASDESNLSQINTAESQEVEQRIVQSHDIDKHH